MDALDRLAHAIHHGDSLLDETVLEPDPDRPDGTGTAGTRPTRVDWLIAKLAGDGDLERAAAKLFDRPELLLSARIEARLLPGEPCEAASLAFLETRGAKLLAAAP